MKTLLRLCLSATTFVALAACAQLNAQNVSGVYADKGVVVQPSQENAAKTVSFHGLLSQEFDSELSGLNFATTSHITLEDENDVLALEIFDQDGQRTWRSVWGANRGFNHMEGNAIIRMKMGKSKDERCVLVMKPTEGNRALMVSVYHVKTSYFGPFSEPIGVYIFARQS